MRARIGLVAAAVAMLVGVAVPAATAGETQERTLDQQCIALVIAGQQGDGVCIPLP